MLILNPKVRLALTVVVTAAAALAADAPNHTLRELGVTAIALGAAVGIVPAHLEVREDV